MALPPHRTFAKSKLQNGLGVNGLNGNAPRGKALEEIKNFSALITRLLPCVMTADPEIQFESSHALLDLLFWLANTVFHNALGRYSLAIKQQAPWNNAVDAVLRLQNVIQDMALLHAPAAYVPNPGPNAPIDSALELIYTSVLRNVPPNDFGKSSLILTPIHAYTSIVCLRELHICNSLSASF
jgi:hypothetical protein